MQIKLQPRYQLHIGGQWKDASNGATIKTHNPATGGLLAEIADAIYIIRKISIHS